MKKQVQSFSEFTKKSRLNESRFRNQNYEILTSRSSYVLPGDDDARDGFPFKTLEDYYTFSLIDGDIPTEVEDVVNAITRDSGSSPELINILGLLKYEAERMLDYSEATELPTTKGFIGASTVHRFDLQTVDDQLDDMLFLARIGVGDMKDGPYYVVSQYDGMFVAKPHSFFN